MKEPIKEVKVFATIHHKSKNREHGYDEKDLKEIARKLAEKK